MLGVAVPETELDLLALFQDPLVKLIVRELFRRPVVHSNDLIVHLNVDFFRGRIFQDSCDFEQVVVFFLELESGHVEFEGIVQRAVRLQDHPLSGVVEREGKVCYRYGEKPEEVERMDYLEFIARVTSHIPDKGQVTVRYYGIYANAHRGKVRKAQPVKHPFIVIEEESPRIPRRGWAEMIRKVYEVDPLICPQCGGRMRIIAFLTDYAVVDRIIHHLKLSFVAERPPPPHVASLEFLMDSEAPAGHFS